MKTIKNKNPINLKPPGGLAKNTNNLVIGTPIKDFVEDKLKERIFRETTNPSFDTLPGCITYYGHPMKPNGPCETCKCNFICEKCTPKEDMEIIFKEEVKCKTT